MFLRIWLGVFIGVVTITLVGCALALWIPWCTVGQNGCKMGASEWAYWVGAIGTITAVGVAIALASYQNSMHEQREARAEADALHGLLLGIRAELQVSFELVENRVGEHIENIAPGQIFGIDFPISERVLPVYHAMLPSFYLIKDHALRVQIIQACAVANSLVTTFRANNSILAEFAAANSLARRSEAAVDIAIAQEKFKQLATYALGLKAIYAEAKTEILNLLAVLPSK